MTSFKSAIDLAEVERRDKRRAAIHEAGHATVAVAKGFGAYAWLSKTDTSKTLEEKSWVGKCELYKLRPVRFSRVDEQTFAVAGMVAEQLDDSPDVSAWEIMDAWEALGEIDIGLSHTDMGPVASNRRSREVAVEKALAILREKKSLFDKLVSQLFEYGSTDGIIADWDPQRRIRSPAKRTPKYRQKK